MNAVAAFTYENAVVEMGRGQLGHKRRTAPLVDSPPAALSPTNFTTLPPIVPPCVLKDYHNF